MGSFHNGQLRGRILVPTPLRPLWSNLNIVGSQDCLRLGNRDLFLEIIECNACPAGPLSVLTDSLKSRGSSYE